MDRDAGRPSKKKVRCATSNAPAPLAPTIPECAWPPIFEMLTMRELGQLARVSSRFVIRTWPRIHDLACHVYLSVPMSLQNKLSYRDASRALILGGHILEPRGDLHFANYQRIARIVDAHAPQVAHGDAVAATAFLGALREEFDAAADRVAQLTSDVKQVQKQWALAQPLFSCRERPRRTGAGTCVGEHPDECEHCILFRLVRGSLREPSSPWWGTVSINEAALPQP